MCILLRSLAVLLLLPLAAQGAEPLRVYAAASLANALTEIGAQWTTAGHPRPTLVFAASSALAKQVENGAPADIYASADAKWTVYLAERRKLVEGSRRDLLGNALVLIAPRGREPTVELQAGFDLPGAFSGKLCTGEPDVVPAGTYARQALTAIGWWPALAPRIVGTDDVRTALAFVERGECPLGIVYATDAAISDKVRVVGRFPAGSHDPIVYPFSLVSRTNPDASAFLDYLQTDAAARVFERHGFVLAPH